MKFKLKNYFFFSIPVEFRLSWGKMGYSRHIFLCLEDENGHLGFGEGVLYKTTFLNFLPYFKSSVLSKEGFSTHDVNNFLDFEPALSFALDTAILDLEEKLKPENKYGNITEEIFLEDNIEAKIKQFLKNKTKYVKLKVGENVIQDKNNISKINNLTKGTIKIKIDANRGYSFSDAKEMSSWGEKNNVILFEEPVNSEFNTIAKLRNETPLPIMLDESIQSLKQLGDAINSNCFDVLNIKLARLGGISNAQKYITFCQKNNKKVSLGCSEELNIGMSAILNLAKKTNNLYGVEGYGPDRLKIDLGLKDQYIKSFNSLSAKYGIFGYKKDQNELSFKIKEFYGIWSTRLDNAIHLIIK